eukprot:SAG11_NODE_3780_length_2231_cov_1.947467_2_plen_96_part_00
MLASQISRFIRFLVCVGGMDSENKFRRTVFRIIHSPYADGFVFLCIFIQTIGLATSIPGNCHDFEYLQGPLTTLNSIFMGVYTVEVSAIIVLYCV